MAFKKRFISAIMAIVLLSCLSIQIPVFADNGSETITYGFSVDTEYYEKPVWYTTIISNSRSAGGIVGVCTTKIGATRSKSKTTDGSYMDHFFVRCTMKGQTINPNTSLEFAGYSESLIIESELPTETELMSYSPTQIANKTTYSIGLSAGSDKSVGISASGEFTKNALEINNFSDTSKRLFKAGYDYQHSFLNWKLNKYSYNESQQYAHFVVKPKQSNYKMSISSIAKFQLWDSEPALFVPEYDQYTSFKYSIGFKTPY